MVPPPTNSKRRLPGYAMLALHGFAVASLLFIASCGGGSDKSQSSTAGVNSGGNAPTPPPVPLPSQAIPAPAFGVQTHFAQSWKLDIVPRISAAGITEVRDELYWQIVEPTRGKFEFPASYDNYMAELKRAGINPLIELTFENKNYDGGNTPHTEEGFNAYARYATEVLRRYGSQIQAVEIWNEYNGSFAKGPATEDRPATYAKMLRVAHDAIKRVRPDVVVVGGATVGVPMPYLERLFEAGALNHMDVVSVHPYRSNATPEGIEAQITALQELIKRHNYGQPKPIWVTEIGWGERDTGARGDLVIDAQMQAKFLVRAYALLYSAGVQRVYWYLFRDYMDFESMGLVRNDAGYTAKPAHRAMANLIAHLRDAVFVEREKTSPNVYSIRFRRPSGEDVRVMWSLDPITFMPGSAAQIVDLLGNQVASTGSVRLDDSPIIVSGNTTIPTFATGNSASLITDAAAGFTSRQGENGWSYGAFIGDSTEFQPITFRTTDWKEEWWDDTYRHLSLTSADQHPSAREGVIVSAVRRWQSNFSGRVRVQAQFRVDASSDGVRVRIFSDGQEQRRADLGGGHPVSASFDFELIVQPGTTIDFAVDPGAAAKIENDATAVVITLQRVS